MFIRNQLSGYGGFLGNLSPEYYEACCEQFDHNHLASVHFWKLCFFGA